MPVITGNYRPFRLVLRENDNWNPTIEQVNRRSYDYVKLHRMSMFVDIGILPLSLGVSFDGTLVLPATKQFVNPKEALTHFNTFLCSLLLGGIYCEAVSPDDVCLGRMTHTAYSKITGNNRGAVSGFHQAIRTTAVGILDAIRLLDPETVRVTALKEALSVGKSRLARTGSLSPQTLLHGATFYAKNQWADSLIHLWTSVEQVLEDMWSERILSKSSVLGITKSRRRGFLGDRRTWTASAKLELLYQKALLPEETYARLDKARTQRNAFAHSGAIPSPEGAEAALDGLFQLVSLRIADSTDPRSLLSVADLIKERSRLYASWERRGEPLEGVTHWLEVPPVPGDVNWGDAPYEIIEDLQLRKLNQPIE